MPVRVVMEQLDADAEARRAEESREVLAAGFRSRGSSAAGDRSGSGFGSGETLDVLEPGPSLAALADGATRDGGLAGLDDDELIGVLRAWRRLESWSAAGTFAAVAELARRRPAEGAAPAGPGEFPERMSEFVSDEVAAALVLTGQAASTCLDLALDLAIRLPGTARALRAGVIDYLKARMIAEATRVLTDVDARAVEDMVLPAAGGQTSGRLRAALARAVLAVDPEGAARRREQAEKDPRVRRWREDAGTAALAGYSLPAAEVLEADQAITTRALDLRAAGLAGTLEELRARAYLDALLGRDSTVLSEPAPGSECEPGAPGQSPAGGPSGPAGGDATGAGPGSGAPDPEADGTADQPAGRTDRDRDVRPDANGAADQSAPEPKNDRRWPARARAGEGGRLAARVNLTVPLTTLLGLADEPGGVGGFGPLDPALARQIGRLAGAHPATRWCLTVTDGHGQAIGHGCLPGRRPAEIFGTGSGAGPPERAGPGGLLARDFTVTITALARGICEHRNEEPGYEPSRRLRHLLWARTATCSAPGCSRPAAQCDLDHTVPYDQGGRTCECNLAPLCRHDHRRKQAEGWRLEQPEPGVMCWTTPAGRHYVTTPTRYPC